MRLEALLAVLAWLRSMLLFMSFPVSFVDSLSALGALIEVAFAVDAM